MDDARLKEIGRAYSMGRIVTDKDGIAWYRKQYGSGCTRDTLLARTFELGLIDGIEYRAGRDRREDEHARRLSAISRNAAPIRTGDET